MRLWIGQSGQGGDSPRPANGLDLLEVRVEAGRAPKRSRLRRMREGVGDSFVFSVVCSAPVSTLTPTDAEFEECLNTATALGARWLLVRTPPSVTPTARHRERLRALAERVPKDCALAWEPSGIWEDDEAEALAEQIGATLVRDLTQSDAPAGDVVYTRLRALGHGGRLGVSAVDRVIDRLEGANEAFVVVEGRSAPAVARELRGALGDDAEGELDSARDDDDDELADDSELDDGRDIAVDPDDDEGDEFES